MKLTSCSRLFHFSALPPLSSAASPGKHCRHWLVSTNVKEKKIQNPRSDDCVCPGFGLFWVSAHAPLLRHQLCFGGAPLKACNHHHSHAHHLQGFSASYSAHECPHNCSSRGTCDKTSNTCICPPGGLNSYDGHHDNYDSHDDSNDGQDDSYDDDDNSSLVRTVLLSGSLPKPVRGRS